MSNFSAAIVPCPEPGFSQTTSALTALCGGRAPTQLTALGDSAALTKLITECSTPYLALVLEPGTLELGQFFAQRTSEVLQETGAPFAYSDYFLANSNKLTNIPLANYQPGSVRDDFSFGPIVVLNVAHARAALKQHGPLSQSKHAAWYELRLLLSMTSLPARIAEPLSVFTPLSLSSSHDKQFKYVDPKNRAVQIELEQCFTSFSRKAGFYLTQRTKTIDPSCPGFTNQATVIIPVKNRKNTIADAVKSALGQQLTGPFNVIVVDNHSDDGTTELLAGLAKQNHNLVHLIPQRRDLLIGGCWNEALHHPACGQFAVQLDSDDLYIDQHTLQKVVDVFTKERCAAVVGSYRLVNFDLKEIPPGLIDHREWSDENGHNNALRINGLGAPRAFFTPVARQLRLPNVSYGEDYSIMLRILREYKLGRIYEPLYLCRRWDGNSDANPSVETMNRFNTYKDWIRTIEISARRSGGAASHASN